MKKKNYFSVVSQYTFTFSTYSSIILLNNSFHLYLTVCTSESLKQRQLIFDVEFNDYVLLSCNHGYVTCKQTNRFSDTNNHTTWNV